MRWMCVGLLATVLAIGQTTQKYGYDVNGNRVAGSEVIATGTGRTERAQSINGRRSPIERVEERVIRNDASGKEVERVIHRFSADGDPLPVERVLVQEEKHSTGSTVRTSKFQADVNGGQQLVERSTADLRKDGTSMTTDVTVERRSVDGSFRPAERRVVREQKTDASASATENVFRPDANGNFVEAARETTESRTSNGRTSAETQRYEANGDGKLQLAGATNRTTVKQADGSESTVIDVLAPHTPGLVNSNGPKIREQQIIERRPVEGGTIETISVRRPGISNPDRLGAAERVSEVVCTGNCQ